MDHGEAAWLLMRGMGRGFDITAFCRRLYTIKRFGGHEAEGAD